MITPFTTIREVKRMVRRQNNMESHSPIHSYCVRALLMRTVCGVVILLLCTANAFAVTITANFNLGTVRQNFDGSINTTGGGIDVTATVQNNIQAAIQWWEMAILKDFNLTIEFHPFSNLGGSTLGLHVGLHEDSATNFLSQSLIQFSDQFKWFFDPTPLDNSEFTMTNFTDPSTGLNAGREGFATATGPAVGRFDFLSVVKHEIGHALGMSLANTRWNNNVINAVGTKPANTARIPAALSGLSSDLDVITTGSHIDATAQSGRWQHALMTPSIASGMRRVQSEIDILVIGANYGLARDEINTNPHHVPEPSTLSLLIGGLGGVFGYKYRKLLTCSFRRGRTS